MYDLSERLKQSAEVLDQLDRKRGENAMRPEDHDSENRILMTELRELEEDIVRDPGALQANLVPVRRRRDKGIEPR